MTMAKASYWSSLLSWLASYTSAGTNTSASSPSKSRASAQPASSSSHKKDPSLAETLTQPRTGPRSDSPRSELEFEYDSEYEMYDVGGSGKSRGHGRSQSESAATNHRLRTQRVERAYNTLPRSYAQKTQNQKSSTAHSRTSSYTPVVVIPGVVNSSFLLFSPEIKGNRTVRRRVQPIDTDTAPKSELEKREEEREAERKRRGEEFDGETSEEGSGSPRSRRSFDSFRSSDSQTSDTSYGTQSSTITSNPGDERGCTLSHRAPYTISDR